MKIDARLIAIYNEYLENNKEYDFVEMLYALIDNANADVIYSVMKDRRKRKAKETREANKPINKKIEEFFAHMSPEDYIKFLNTPWEQQPEWIKENMKRLVKYTEEFNFLRVAGIVSKESHQQETFGARLVRYMKDKGFITSDEEGTKLHYENFAAVCNELAEKYDLKWRPGHKAQRTRITEADLKGYTRNNITPKKDKLTVISCAMDVPVAYLGGYGPKEPPKTFTGPFGPVGTGPVRKKRAKKDEAA